MKIKRIERYISEEAEDLNIDKNHLTTCLINLPKVHSKYLKYYYREQSTFIKMDQDRRDLFRKKHKYYSTEYELEIKSNQLIWYIESDKEYSSLLTQISVQKKIIEYLEDILNKIKTQNFIISNIVKWEMWKTGI
jgi:hypothetical protein